MRIGVGITTYNRPECLKKCLEQINKHSFMDGLKVYVATDTDEDRRGVAYRKNECLRALKDCDDIILLDDDCYPISDGWIEFLISSKYNHLLYLNDSHRQIMNTGTHTFYGECGGVMMYFKREVLEKVGAFNEDFKLWGFEHAEYSLRVFKAKLTPASYIMKNGTEKYLYSEDYSNPSHKSSITNEEKYLLFQNNQRIFAKPITQIYRPL